MYSAILAWWVSVFSNPEGTLNGNGGPPNPVMEKLDSGAFSQVALRDFLACKTSQVELPTMATSSGKVAVSKKLRT